MVHEQMLRLLLHLPVHDVNRDMTTAVHNEECWHQRNRVPTYYPPEEDESDVHVAKKEHAREHGEKEVWCGDCSPEIPQPRSVEDGALKRPNNKHTC